MMMKSRAKLRPSPANKSHVCMATAESSVVTTSDIPTTSGYTIGYVNLGEQIWRYKNSERQLNRRQFFGSRIT